MDQGVGIANQLRSTGQRLAQLAMADLCRGWRLEFAIHAGATVEYLAKAEIAKKDVRTLFQAPDELTDAELTILQPPSSRPSLTTSQSDRSEARRRIAQRRTISARSAIDRAADLLREEGRELDVATARSVLDTRNRAVHLADLDPATDWLTASAAVSAAESLWDQRPVELWGYFGDVAAAIAEEPPDDLHWSTVSRIALSRERHALQGIVSNFERVELLAEEPSVVCPACGSPAHLKVRRGPGPFDVSSWTTEQTIEVLTCMSCGLQLFGREQIDHA